MIHINSITNALKTVLTNDATLISENVDIQVNEIFNTDASITPWLGIYHQPFTIEPHTAAFQAPWLAEVKPVIYLQVIENTFQGESKCNNLDKLLFDVLTVVNSNRTLLYTVDMLTDISVTPFELDIDNDNSSITYEINLNYEKRV